MARDGHRIVTIIPALNEEASIGKVIQALPSWIDEVIVCDNGSTDRTSSVAQHAGATVVHQPERGYGAACLSGLARARQEPPDIVLFIDGDFSDDPSEADLVVDPVIQGHDLCIGSRALGTRLKGAITPQQIFGNWLATRLIRLFWHTSFTDLGPFRAIRWSALERMNMTDRNYGWTVEMQIKAAKMSMRCTEVPVSYRPRIGKSKVSGTIKGSIMAGTIILYTIARHVFR
jgi:glycosyltransferase involved in cell wall biosynthesis